MISFICGISKKKRLNKQKQNHRYRGKKGGCQKGGRKGKERNR